MGPVQLAFALGDDRAMRVMVAARPAQFVIACHVRGHGEIALGYGADTGVGISSGRVIWRAAMPMITTVQSATTKPECNPGPRGRRVPVPFPARVAAVMCHGSPGNGAAYQPVFRSQRLVGDGYDRVERTSSGKGAREIR